MGESQIYMAEGIVSISELSKIECGERQADYFTLQALFGRLGKSLDKLELAISDSDYEVISLRDETELCVEQMDPAALREVMKKYRTCCEADRPVHRQYTLMMCAVLQYMEERDYEGCLRQLDSALAVTLPKQRRDKGTMHEQRLCSQEVRIILMTAYCKKMLRRTDGLTGMLEQFERYILHYYRDREEQVKVYPQCVWLLGGLYLEEGRVEEAYAVCRKGIKILTENGSLLVLRELLALEEGCLKRMGKEKELERCGNYQAALSFLYEVAGQEQNTDAIHIFMKSTFQGEFIITNELVRELRKANKMSQAQLCEGICTQETLSRIESGRRSPNKKNLCKLLKKMGMERETSYGFIVAEDYVLYEKARLYNRCTPQGRYEEEERLLSEIESQLDMTIPVNRQFVGLGCILSKVNKKELSRKEANEQLKELLYITMPQISDRLVYRVPFRMEYHIINFVALNLRADGYVEDALHIYQQIMQCYGKSRVCMKYHMVPGLTLYLNYAGFLEVNNQLEESEQIAKEGLLNGIACCRGDMGGEIIANLSLVYGKKQMYEMEEKCLRYGYYLVELYERESSRGIIQRVYEEKYHKNIG